MQHSNSASVAHTLAVPPFVIHLNARQLVRLARLTIQRTGRVFQISAAIGPIRRRVGAVILRREIFGLSPESFQHSN